MSTFKLIRIVGHLESVGLWNYETVQAACLDGDDWLGEEEHTVECEIEAGNYVAAEIPTYYVVQDASTGAQVYRSGGMWEAPPAMPGEDA